MVFRRDGGGGSCGDSGDLGDTDNGDGADVGGGGGDDGIRDDDDDAGSDKDYDDDGDDVVNMGLTPPLCWQLLCDWHSAKYLACGISCNPHSLFLILYHHHPS